ncbi:phosphatidate cytidylyltransferase [Campylobacter hyointestinalis]|uniref:Phosphatidate cytidylyltransferase n=1 Tax=Campylobacter hyointestinalis subsp. lawsonii TaxID=91353 RepID=A0AAV6ED78_CAMHY|nr:phosphatidate cytidylyltransferase [Campylobacter hyointestinalis]KAB0612382.1 phosphatidate cytidylyltransferase [Campylobacter hyointestinalis subsp. lawsonii]QKF68834.1 CDP-diglyceride synthetase [Campylobacter hyointestinalis subsp. lawsonii]RAZ27777.1 phosphatidate cytidylyltransferase [Campylobacter hyointestinalis subsp. lawsonii]
MKNRIIVGLLLFVIFLGIALLDIFWLNFLIFGIILATAFLESLKLYKIEQKNLVFIALVFYSILPFLQGINDIFKVILLNLIIISSVLAYTKSDNMKLILPFLYPTVPIFMMFALYQNYGIECLFWLVFTIIISDTAAYFVGKYLGRHQFSASSPNKTIEGVIGGVVFGSVFGTAFAFIFVDVSYFMAASCSILLTIFGVFGDLFESYLKRRVDIKDSGALLGAHGGILDRMDGYLFGVVAMFLVLA